MTDQRNKKGLSLRLLGPPQIVLNGTTLTFARRKAVALLAYLVITGQPASRDILANLLGGETSEQRARRHLRNALADLSGQLGDYLLVSRQTIAFNATLPRWLDIEAFQRLLDDGTARRRGYTEAGCRSLHRRTACRIRATGHARL